MGEHKLPYLLTYLRWQQVVVMEFGKRHDTTDTTDFCLRQLGNGLATGKLV